MENQLFPSLTECHFAKRPNLSACALAIGAFDGVHKGHQKLINRMIVSARELGVPSVVYTFDPVPKVFFGAAHPIISLPEKLDRLSSLGIDDIVVANFDEAYRTRDASEFIEEIGLFNPQIVWVGRDFRFGACKSGDPDLLHRYFETRVFPQYCCGDGEPISSTRIRALTRSGYYDAASELQGWRGFNFGHERESALQGGVRHG